MIEPELLLVLVLLFAVGGIMYCFWTRTAKGEPSKEEKLRAGILRALATAGELCIGQLGCDLRTRSSTIFTILRELEADRKVEPHPESGRDPYENNYRHECPWALKL